MRSLSILVLAACGARAPEPLGNTAPRPAGGLMVAVDMYPSGVTIASVGTDGVKILKQTDSGQELGWLDAHTLIVLDPRSGGEEGPAVMRFVDNQLVETIELPLTEWMGPLGARLALGNTGQIWVSSCDELTGDSTRCRAWSYLRVMPAPRVWAKRRPAGVEEHRTAYAFMGAEPWPLPPTVAAPPGMALRLVPIELGSNKLTGVECRSGKQSVVYPDFGDASYGYEAHTARWVQRVPPIYEVFADRTSPVNTEEPERLYFRPCEAAPLDNYAWLGGDTWGAYEEPPPNTNHDGLWTFYRGKTKLGTLAGLDALRPNRGPEPAR